MNLPSFILATLYFLSGAFCLTVSPEWPTREIDSFKHRYLPDIRPNIVGGKPVEPQFAYGSWIAAVLKNDYQFCAGSLIHPNLMVTAGHCSVLGIPFENLRVVSHRFNLSRSPKEEDAVVMTVKEIHTHPLFNYNTLEYDIAVWRLEGGTSTADFVKIDEGEYNRAGLKCKVIGWGATDEMADGSEILQEVEVPLMEQGKCKKVLGSRITESMICAGGNAGRDACQGDSGGPLIHFDEQKNPVLIGVVSWGRGCARPNYPGVYSRISTARKWLNSFLYNTTEHIPQTLVLQHD